MKKKVLSLILAGVTFATPVLSSTTAFADQPTNTLQMYSAPIERAVYNSIGYNKSTNILTLYKNNVKADSFNVTSISSVVANGYNTTGNKVVAAQVVCNFYASEWKVGKLIAEDGSFGPATLAQVKAVQAAIGLPADGSFGPNTWTKALSHIF